LLACPDCGATQSNVLGQYVYYSTLLQLRACGACGLAYADARIDPRVVAQHFDSAYKDEDYFTRQRKPIFQHLARLVDACAPRGGSVIDVGGAKGHLLAAVREKRPDLALTLNDIAEQSCVHARETYGLRAVRGSVAELASIGERFDVILMIDVLYYEPEIRTLWQTIDRLGKERCTVILRLPDRIGFISLQRALGALTGRGRRSAPTSIPGFNPEHVAVYSKPYLRRRLAGLGFSEIRFLPSPMLRSAGLRGLLATLYERAASWLNGVTRSAATFTPCFIVVARRFR
jgi:hypothetical protein